ncbi:hypothetical protein D3C81_1673430 [compost metagenome]
MRIRLEESPDKDRSNAIATTGCNVNAAPPADSDVYECNAANVTGSWDATYWVFTVIQP